MRIHLPSRELTLTLSLLVVVALAGCLCVQEETARSADLSARQTELLAQKILDNTPEHLHWVQGTTFSWVLLSPQFDRNPQPIREEVERQLSRKYSIYKREEDLPPDSLVKDTEGRRIGYRGGFSFSFKVELEQGGTLKVHFSDYEGQLAGSSHWERYKWTGKDWKSVEKSPMIVS